MNFRSQRVALVCLLLGTFNSCATFGPEEAKAAYRRGLELEKAKKYLEAMAALKPAAESGPVMAEANREMGNCSFYLGKKADAFAYYDCYVALNPADIRMKDFAGTLRKQLSARELDYGGHGSGRLVVRGWMPPQGVVSAYSLYGSEQSGAAYHVLVKGFTEDMILVRGVEKGKKYYFHLTAWSNTKPSEESRPSPDFTMTGY